jgi:hypothetical protein
MLRLFVKYFVKMVFLGKLKIVLTQQLFKRRWDGHTNLGLKEISWECMDWIELAQIRVQMLGL